MKDTYGKLTSLVVYNAKYFHTDSTKRVQIKFFLGKYVAVNVIIGIPTLNKCKDSITFENNCLTSPLIQTKFPIIYKPANTGLTYSVTFDYKEFIQPGEVTSSGQTVVMNISSDITNINVNSGVKPSSIFTI